MNTKSSFAWFVARRLSNWVVAILVIVVLVFIAWAAFTHLPWWAWGGLVGACLLAIFLADAHDDFKLNREP